MSEVIYPDDWISGHLGDFTFESRLRLKDSNFESLPVYGVDNVVGLNTEPRYMAAELDRYKVIREGMFAYNPMRLNIGSIGYAFRGSHTGIVSPDYVVFGCLETLDSDYLHHFTQSFQWDQLTEDAGSGSVRFRIYYSEIARFPIVLPPLPEQRAIAAILSTWDDAIALTSRLIDALKRRKQALMQRLLTGQTRFSEFAGEEWESMAFSGFAHRVGEQVDPLASTFDMPCVELEHIESETGRILGQTTLKAQKSLKNRFYAGQVLFGKLRPYLKKYAQPDFDGATTSEVWVLNSRNDNSNDFLFYLVQSDAFTSAANATSGTKMPRADWSLVADTAFEIPQPTEQARIADLLKIFDTELQLHNEIEEQLQTQKRALMQRLLTGQVRVNLTP